MPTRGDRAKDSLKGIIKEVLDDFFKDAEEAPKKDEKKSVKKEEADGSGLEALADFLDVPKDDA